MQHSDTFSSGAITTDLFLVNGKNLSTLLIDETSLKFSSSSAFNRDEFEKAWNKKISLSNKIEIRYAGIKSITKEDAETELKISYKNRVGIPSEVEFSFTDASDTEQFFTYLEKQQYFQHTYERLLPWKAIQNYLIGLAFTMFITIFSYFEAIDIANGTAVRPHGGKGRLFNFIVGLLGPYGVITVGACICLYIIYIMRKRFQHPPHVHRLVPMHQ